MIGSLLKSVRNIAVGLVTLPFFICFLFYMFALFNGDFTWDEMDINKDGFVSPIEAGYFSDSGTREVEINGKKCIEFFAYKDARSLKVTCDG
ncbi:hypothetical protein AAOGI_21530 [Agarivorans albus]